MITDSDMSTRKVNLKILKGRTYLAKRDKRRGGREGLKKVVYKEAI